MTLSEIRQQLLTGDAEFRRLAEDHARYATELEQLSRAPYRSAEDLELESHLKKLKLRIKDEMEKRIARHLKPASSQ
jgi:uncharacterized protein YdcH (DUF465 family)